MAQKTDADLQTQRAEIENETATGANTTARVGQMLEDEIDSKINNDKIIDEDDMSSDSATHVPTQQSVKAYVDANGGGAVDSVNGQTGVVVLGAGDVGADPVGTAAALLTTTISNGDTTHAPNGNAVFDALALKQDLVNSATAITDASTMDLTAIKHTLATSSATRTFTISYTGDDITLEVTLSAVSSVFTFPATSLCVSEGVASGNNTCSLNGVSGDTYIIAVKKIGSNYRVVCKNFGQ